MNQLQKVFQEYCTPASIQRLNYELLLTTAEERFGTLQLRANDPKYPEFVVIKMKPGDICGLNGCNASGISDENVSEAYLPLSLTIKGHRDEDFQCYIPIPGSKKLFEVNENLAKLFPTSSIQTLKRFFLKVSQQAKVRLDFGYEDSSSCSDR